MASLVHYVRSPRAYLRVAHIARMQRQNSSRSMATAAVSESERPIGSMPPGYVARIGALQTFHLPYQVSGNVEDKALGKALIQAFRKDGILQIAMEPTQQDILKNAMAASKDFFRRPYVEKAACVDSQSYSGYIASGEEITGGIADYSEIFTVTKDLPLDDRRVRQRWPCHGPCPWPDIEMKKPMTEYMKYLGESGEKLLSLIGLGLDAGLNCLTKYTKDGWHHMRVLRFPANNKTNGKGKDGRGIGSHTDYGLLVIAAQDEVGGLFIRPPYDQENFANWEDSTAGMHENDDKWVYVPPVPNVFTVFPGDMMQYITNSYLPSTPHKVGLNTRERFAFAYFHEPNFEALVKPLEGFHHGQTPQGINYGTHFTNMFLRNYPERITTKRMIREQRLKSLPPIHLLEGTKRDANGMRMPDNLRFKISPTNDLDTVAR